DLFSLGHDGTQAAPSFDPFAQAPAPHPLPMQPAPQNGNGASNGNGAAHASFNTNDPPSVTSSFPGTAPTTEDTDRRLGGPPMTLVPMIAVAVAVLFITGAIV